MHLAPELCRSGLRRPPPPARARPPPRPAAPTAPPPPRPAAAPAPPAGLGGPPRPTATETARPDPRGEQPLVTVRVPRGIIPHGAPVVVSVRTRPEADALITLRLTRQGTRCTGAARQRVCARVTTVLSQRVVHPRQSAGPAAALHPSRQ